MTPVEKTLVVDPSSGRNPASNHLFGSLEQYRIVVDELKMHEEIRLEDAAYEKLLAFHFELPYQLPWPDNPQSTSWDDRFAVHRFRMERRNLELADGYTAQYFVTSVTSVVPANKFSDLPEALSEAFDWILDDLNGLFTAYSIVTKDGEVTPLSIPMLGPTAIWGFIEPYEAKASVGGLMLLNPLNVPYEKATPPPQIVHEVARLKLVSGSTGYPFVTSWQLRIEAEHQLRKGHYHVAAVLIGSAFEARANELLTYWYWKAGKSEEEISQLLSTVPFVRRLRNEFERHIGGVFNPAVPGSIRHWHTRSHQLRNRVIHGGYRPTQEETMHSFVAMIQAWDYIMALVRDKCSDFPELSPFIELRGQDFLWPPRK